jgi:hypothetical protein
MKRAVRKTKKAKPLPAKMGRPRNNITDHIARELAVTKRQAEKLEKELESGGDLDDMKAARLRKLKLEGDRLQHLLDVERGKFLLAAKVKEDFASLGRIVKTKLYGWVGAMPGRLEGLTAAQMVPILQDEVDKVLGDLATSP